MGTSIHWGDTDDVVGRARTNAVLPRESLFQHLIHTEARATPAIARLAAAIIMLPHALQKAFGWFGGQGLSGSFEGFTKHVGLPGPLAFLAILAEIGGTLLLLFGVLTRVGALAVMAVMFGAIFAVHMPNGFFMNWTGQQAGEGFEYHLLMIALLVVPLIDGGGKVSIDQALMKWRPAEGGSVSPALGES
jgi:putative oxidoreductase